MYYLVGSNYFDIYSVNMYVCVSVCVCLHIDNVYITDKILYIYLFK